MKYIKSEIMNNAHSIRKTSGVSMATALRKSWAAVKIKAIDNRLFGLKMKDRWSADDFNRDRSLRNERNQIAKTAGIELQTEIIKAAPAPIKVKNPALSEAERREIENAMFDMMTRRLYDGTFDMNEYQALQSRLHVSVTDNVA